MIQPLARVSRVTAVPDSQSSAHTKLHCFARIDARCKETDRQTSTHTCDKRHLVVQLEALCDEVVVQACHNFITTRPPAVKPDCCVTKGHRHNHAVRQDTSAKRCVLQLLEGGKSGNRLHAAGKQGHEFVSVKCCERYLLCTILTPSLKGKATTSTLSSLMTYSLNSLIAMAILSEPPSGVYTRPCMKTHHCRVSLFTRITRTTAQETICN